MEGNAMSLASNVDLSTLSTTITSSVQPTTIISFIAAGLGIAITFVLAWFGARKLWDMVQSAMKGRKVKM